MLLRVFLGLVLLASCVACSKQVPVEANRTSQVSLDEAIQLVQSGSYSQALPLLEKAIASGGLQADTLADAYTYRARCYADANEIEKATQDLSFAEQGSASPALYLVAKGTLLHKQGKKAEAETAFRNAKQIDKNVVVPKL